MTVAIAQEAEVKYYSEENQSNHEEYELSSFIEIRCPFCVDHHLNVSTWGSYPTKNGSKVRYFCRECGKTFNSAQLLYWKNKIKILVWKIAQIIIGCRVSIRSLALRWKIPEKALRGLINKIKFLLATRFEEAKLLQERFEKVKPEEKQQFRILAYDEGFLKVLGIKGYLLFTLDGNGKPLTVEIEEDRTAETIYTHFLTAMTQQGGVDVVIADGAPAILTALRALRTPLFFIQHIHKDDGKRARIISISPVKNKKYIWETTMELHTGSLLPNLESIVTVSRTKRYPKRFSGNKKVINLTRESSKRDKESIKREGVLTPEETQKKRKTNRSNTPKILKGEKVVLTTGPNPGQVELSWLDPSSSQANDKLPTLQELCGMALVTQLVLPNQFITSNIAERFNALHDREQVYWGRKNFEHVNQDLLAWIILRFYPKGAEKILSSTQWNISSNLLSILLPLGITRIIIP